MATNVSGEFSIVSGDGPGERPGTTVSLTVPIAPDDDDGLADLARPKSR